MTQLEEVYEDVILKLVACMNKTDRKKISKITIRAMDRSKVQGARPEPPDHFAEPHVIVPPKETKFIITSIKFEQEVFKPKS